MNILNSVSNITALLLTLIVFSGLLGRNFLFRLAESLLIGISAGYFAAVLIFSVIIPTLESATGDQAWLVIPVLLGLLLFLPQKTTGPWAKISEAVYLPSAFILVISLALNAPLYFSAFLREMIRASIVPMVSLNADGSIRWDLTLNAVLSVISVVSVLWFLVARHKIGNRVIYSVGEVGRLFLLAAVGTVFGYALVSRLILFIGRFNVIIQLILQLTS
ncbi:hypothetical protein J6Z39_06205 [bacterium]|nr:hypothetical protein [bacterium]MBR6245670.1 hypothetical protein [bacterium]